MSSLNEVNLIGNLGKDPVTRFAPNGKKIVSFSLATYETWKDKKSGERKSVTEWHNIVIFNESLGTVAETYLLKGSKVYLKGSIKTRKYADKSGAEKYVTEVVIPAYGGGLILLTPKNSIVSDFDDDVVSLSQPSNFENNDISDEIPF